MTYKICFVSGAWQEVQCDDVVFDEMTLACIRDGRPIFTGVLRNTAFWRVVESTPVPLDAQVGGFAARV
jgi:hypothetical protein